MNQRFPQFYGSKQIKTKEQKDRDRERVVNIMAVSIAVLVDNFEFTEDEVQNFAKIFMDYIGDINNLTLNLEWIKEQLKEHYDIEVKGI